jgi:hypothetical protein
MELNEFVRLDPDKIRRDKGLMQLYVKFYEAAFSFLPNCVGCSFKKGFKKLSRHANGTEKTVNFDKTYTTMEKTFTLKNQWKLKILSFKKDGKTYRSYGYNLTEEFARDLVKAGKSDVFAKLPSSSIDIETSEEKNKETFQKFVTISAYNDMDYRTEILPLYNEIKDRTGKSAEGKSKADIIKFLEANEG